MTEGEGWSEGGGQKIDGGGPRTDGLGEAVRILEHLAEHGTDALTGPFVPD